MSVSLSIDLADGKSEELPLGPQDAARAWGRIGKGLGLKWLDGDYPIILRPSNIVAVIEELKVALHESETRFGQPDERMQRIIARLDHLSREVGWSAMLG
jgi:hypothetical protein